MWRDITLWSSSGISSLNPSTLRKTSYGSNKVDKLLLSICAELRSLEIPKPQFHDSQVVLLFLFTVPFSPAPNSTVQHSGLRGSRCCKLVKTEVDFFFFYCFSGTLQARVFLLSMKTSQQQGYEFAE